MSIPRTKKATSVPGDNLAVTIESAADITGRRWPRGTQVRPIAGGYDQWLGCRYAEVSALGSSGWERVCFAETR